MAIERRLTEIAGRGRRQAAHGALAQRPGRDRRRAVRARRGGGGARSRSAALIEVLLARAESHVDWPMPGYTHLQRAQPVYLGHHLLAYAWMFLRDRGRFAAVIEACGVLPLGAGALAGVNFATDRERVAAELGFASVAAELDRRGLQPRLRARLPRRRRDRRDAPLAPRRRAGAVEQRGVRLLRARATPGARARRSCRRRRTPTPPSCCARRRRAIVAHLAALHGVMHGLPLTYNKDMQEDKEHLFDTADTLALSLAAARGMLETVAFRRERLRRGGGRRADRRRRRRRPARVEAACPFREAHGAVAGLVRVAVEQRPHAVELQRRRAGGARAGARPGRRCARCCAEPSWLESKVSAGGTALVRVREQLAAARAALADGVSDLLRARRRAPSRGR